PFVLRLFHPYLLQRMRSAGRDQLVLCGVYAHVGVLISTVDAYSNDIQPFLVADAIAAFSEAHQRTALGETTKGQARI
ncbi:isochorismatase family protein, partial [Klebsiella pneumoniae]|uniref:isochorismatase family protein n=1 Tax=Klebsiella pneumoniae TaxID=573 RepID=UPI0039692868